MKPDWSHLEQFRKRHPPMESPTGERAGAFYYPAGKGLFQIIASSGSEPGLSVPWEHVSVCVQVPNGSRLPTWPEMCRVKDLFWDENEVVMQLHPAKKNYVNNHPSVLHLWKPIGREIPTPSMILV